MSTKQHEIRRIWTRHGVRCLFGIVVGIGAVACGPSPEPVHQTVEYYRTNREARKAKLAECTNDPGALGQTPDCINARQAARVDIKSLRDLAPLELPAALPSAEQHRSDVQGREAGATRNNNK